MIKIKRIEIVTNSVELHELERALHALGLSGYTVIPGVLGSGDRGRVSGDEMTGVCSNIYVLLAVPEDKLSVVVKIVKPMLDRFGGICLVSDAVSLPHGNDH